MCDELLFCYTVVCELWLSANILNHQIITSVCSIYLANQDLQVRQISCVITSQLAQKRKNITFPFNLNSLKDLAS